MKPISDILTEIPALAEEAWLTYGTRPIVGERTGRRTVPGSRVLADLDRMLALSCGNEFDGLGVLTTWVRAITEELVECGEPPDHPANTVPAACAWLSAHMRWCSGRGFELEMHDDLRRLHSTLAAVCMVRPEYRPRCRRCAHVVAGFGAGGVRTDDWSEASHGLCLGCGETYPKGPALDALGRLQEFTLAEIAARTKFNEWTLRDWAKKNLIAPKGRQGNAKTYDIGTVMLMIEASRRVA